jgi:hypothetical protein
MSSQNHLHSSIHEPQKSHIHTKISFDDFPGEFSMFSLHLVDFLLVLTCVGGIHGVTVHMVNCEVFSLGEIHQQVSGPTAWLGLSPGFSFWFVSVF